MYADVLQVFLQNYGTLLRGGWNVLFIHLFYTRALTTQIKLLPYFILILIAVLVVTEKRRNCFRGGVCVCE